MVFFGDLKNRVVEPSPGGLVPVMVLILLAEKEIAVALLKAAVAVAPPLVSMGHEIISLVVVEVIAVGTAPSVDV